MHSVKQKAMQEEMRIFFNSIIASTHWTDRTKIMSESMLIPCTKFKVKNRKFFNTADTKHSKQGVLHNTLI